MVQKCIGMDKINKDVLADTNIEKETDPEILYR